MSILTRLKMICEEIDARILTFNTEESGVSAEIEIEDTVLTLNYDYENGEWY